MSNSPTPAKGLEGVVAAATGLSDVRGDIGQLIYCGYDINELAGKVSFEEVVHLLHHDHLPNRKELDELKGLLAAKRERCDLIAMATHGHKGLADVVRGSVANEVRHLSMIPVLMVRVERRRTPRD